MSIAENIAEVRERIAAAARRAARNPDEIMLMGVSKTVPVERMREANFMVDRDTDKASPKDAAKFLVKAIHLPD